ncbi:unnamed protein product [Rhizophagus irregularis]|nr:unnamed protein product [Rhizophagus irregularis]
MVPLIEPSLKKSAKQSSSTSISFPVLVEVVREYDTEGLVQEIIDSFSEQNTKESKHMTSKDESSIPEISAGAPAKILLLIIPAQKPIRRAQEHSLDSVEESILNTPNIYDETAK